MGDNTPLGQDKRINTNTDRAVSDTVANKAAAIYSQCPVLHLMASNGEGGIETYGVIEMIRCATPDTFPREGNDTIPSSEYLAARKILFGEEICVAEVIAPRRIVNLTKHKATPAQRAEGVEDLSDDLRRELLDILVFKDVPTLDDIQYRARRVKGLLADHLRGGNAVRGATVMIGGMPAFDAVLESVLKAAGAHVCYSFTHRVCTETDMPDGSLRLEYTFQHLGFVWVS